MYSHRDSKQLVGQQLALQHLFEYNNATVIQPENIKGIKIEIIQGITSSTLSSSIVAKMSTVMIEQTDVNTMLTAVIGADIIR